MAVLEDGQRIRSNLITSQTDVHRRYGGVVPELASRKHLEALNPMLQMAMEEAGVSYCDLDVVAVTHGPGLIGAVLVGVAVAKTLAACLGLPLLGVNHLEGHLYSPFLENPELEYPLLALLVSGGHTQLVHLPCAGRYQVMGATRDDAAGEAFDKVAKLLELGYPGGPVVDKLATQGNAKAVAFPRPMLDNGYEFSFSGLKTAVRNQVEREPLAVEDLCASFQAAVVEVLVTKMERAADELGVENVVVAGGVACNSGLRRALEEMCLRRGFRLAIPSPRLCTDNAAMIARAGWELYRLGVRSPLDLDAYASMPLKDRI
ncbi:MAG: tRNA (adenosine(37)-N6)-threonylcarbamoyltransferase complex transferase subunit TsaD [Vulcanimicrobiota bacterium]